jgi:hypothetical protein
LIRGRCGEIRVALFSQELLCKVNLRCMDRAAKLSSTERA